ncbi:hypothetical protein V0288_24865 [Pannus brasiliensis CCIBt3594]|uniref:Uncharacterized protein n=1 Tax=Pannus brasiliensis CCIBt3594 TaxID=1427578 RepID=A0AAW9QQM3_9CHRO
MIIVNGRSYSITEWKYMVFTARKSFGYFYREIDAIKYAEELERTGETNVTVHGYCSKLTVKDEEEFLAAVRTGDPKCEED